MNKLPLLLLLVPITLMAGVLIEWEPVYWDSQDRVLVEGELAGYKVYMGKASHEYDTIVPLRGTATEYTFGGLERETPYFFAVTAI